MDLKLAWLLDQQRQKVAARDVSDWEGKLLVIENSCFPKQRDYVLDPATRIVVNIGGRLGKTTAGRARLLRRAMTTPGADCLYIATTGGHAEMLMWEPLKALNHELGLGAEFHETKRIMRLPRNGSTITLVGADDKAAIEKLRGIPRHEVGIDEAASYPPRLLEHLIERVIEPRLGDYNGTLWLVGTPGAMQIGIFADLIRDGYEGARWYADRDLPEYEGWTRWSHHHWKAEDGAPYVPEIASAWRLALQRKKDNGWSDDHPVWRREYLGLPACDDTENVYKYHPFTEDGRPWNQWDPPRLPNGFAKLPEGNWNFVYGLDFGWADDFAVNIFAFRSGDRTLYHCYGHGAKQMYPRKVAILLAGDEWVEAALSGKQLDRPGGLLGITGWPAGTAADKAAGGDAQLAELQNTYGIHLDPAEKKDKHDSIELANGDLIDGYVKILKGSALETQLSSLQWDIGEDGKLKEARKQPNDHADCFIYARRRAFNLIAPPAAEPKPAKHSRRAVESRLDADEERMARVPTEFDHAMGDQDFWGSQ